MIAALVGAVGKSFEGATIKESLISTYGAVSTKFHDLTSNKETSEKEAALKLKAEKNPFGSAFGNVNKTLDKVNENKINGFNFNFTDSTKENKKKVEDRFAVADTIFGKVDQETQTEKDAGDKFAIANNIFNFNK